MLKSVKELRSDFNLLYATEVGSSIKYLKTRNIDFNVFLPSIGKNLQRDFVWNLQQKRELIFSILIGRHIPHMAIINTINETDISDDILLIIDGKQRLSTIFDFIDDKFSIILEEKEYLFSELPNDYKLAIDKLYVRYYVVNEEFDNRITDKDKINWFKFLNFAGTAQELDHMNSLIL
jgi:uncharacterized protein with ParB-like and HNH nuclease domain